jgi:hypothetical protein
MGLNMKERQAVTREYKTRYHKAAKKEKSALLTEFTRLTGYHRKSAIRLLGEFQRSKAGALLLTRRSLETTPSKVHRHYYIA